MHIYLKIFFTCLTLAAVILTLLPEDKDDLLCKSATEHWRYTQKNYALSTDKSGAAKATINAFNKMKEVCK
ncbi:hypothetical protein [Vibrio hibernica]|uniref:hypothetical protein n=1 Tax=Vibrio hibernica TaxID=2587465 RepID=UPI001880A8A9|nr:hypothetical protein [Vibrio hibernica]